MEKRRDFIQFCIRFVAGVGISSSAFLSSAERLYAKAVAKVEKILLPNGTKRDTLIHENPSALDTRNLEITPLEDFQTMGITDHGVDLDTWRFEVAGGVKSPLQFTYSEIQELPSIEKDVLLICPGFFANNGRWKGISMKDFLDRVGMEKDVSHVIFRGPESSYEKVESFPIEEVVSGQVFLAYGVNGQSLPKKHGFPLRVVAEGHYGFEWVKYVYKMTLEKG
ncbi:MAG: molybdopterin-dependent oxidoreductase [Deltaproteobacteria bacterium]|nr:molybdopterin-dependent oxidoreductase [Deltaproteobacteria bacterium]